MDFQRLLDSLLPVLGQAGVDALAEALKELAADQDDDWKSTVLALVADAVEYAGPAGIELARAAIEDLFDDDAPDIDWANPRTASDIVAKLQNAEAGEKSAVRDWFTKFGEALGKIAMGLVKGLTQG